MSLELEYIKTRNIYEYGDILKPLHRDFGYAFYESCLFWCEVIKSEMPDYYWEFRLIKLYGNTIGCCGLYSMNEKTDELWLSWFGLVPELRNLGIGKQVLEYLENEARKINCKTILSYVDKEGKPLPFYKRNGFDVIGTVADYIQNNNVDREEFEDNDDYVIRKNLTYSK